MHLALIALALGGAGSATERMLSSRAVAPSQAPRTIAAAIARGQPPADLIGPNAPPVSLARPVDVSGAYSRNPRDAMLALHPDDPYSFWPSNRPGNPPRPRRREGDKPERGRVLNELNHQTPEIGFSEITGGRDAGRRDVEKRVHIGHSDLWDADGNLMVVNGALDERPNPHEVTYQQRVPASELLGPLNQGRQRAERESGRCVENNYIPTPSRFLAAEPFGSAATGGVPTSTRKLDELIVLRTEKTPVARTAFMGEGVSHGSDRASRRVREIAATRQPDKTAAFRQLGFVGPAAIITERVGKLREVDGRAPERGSVPVGRAPSTMDSAIGDHANKKDAIPAFAVRQAGNSYKVQNPYNFTRGGFHSGSHEHCASRDNGMNVRCIPKASASIGSLNGRPAPARAALSTQRLSGPAVLPPSATAAAAARSTAISASHGTWNKSRHEL